MIFSMLPPEFPILRDPAAIAPAVAGPIIRGNLEKLRISSSVSDISHSFTDQ